MEIGAKYVKLAFEANDDVGLDCVDAGGRILAIAAGRPRPLRFDVAICRDRWIRSHAAARALAAPRNPRMKLLRLPNV